MSAAFLRRAFPNANSILLTGPRPVLVDAGAPGGEAGLLAWLQGREPALLVNTHWHSDHTGGNHALSARSVPIGAAAPDAALINAGHPDACRSEWLRQHVSRYRVDRILSVADVVSTGSAEWHLVPLPGHAPTQIGLFEPVSRTLVAGDAIHDADLGWLDRHADPDALDATTATLERIAALDPQLILSGHGPAIADVPAALARAQRRVASWRAAPERIAWHACKRIFGHLLYTEGGLARDQVAPTLLASPWFRDHAQDAFGVRPAEFVPLLLAEMLRSGAASWRDDCLVPNG